MTTTTNPGEVETLSVHEEIVINNWRFAHNRFYFSATDITNAGKRGKKVSRFGLYNSMSGELFENVMGPLLKLAYNKGSVEEMEAAFKATATKEMTYDFTDFRGIDVLPAGSQKVMISGPKMTIEASLTEFCVSDLEDQNNLPAMIAPSKSKNVAVKKFYAWAKENAETLREMSFSQVSQAMSAAGIGSHYYCRMD